MNSSEIEFVVREFERQYSNGEKSIHVRRWLNKYFVKGGEHVRDKKKRIFVKKMILLHYLLKKN